MKNKLSVIARRLYVIAFLLVCLIPAAGMALGAGSDSTAMPPNLILANEATKEVNLDFPTEFDTYFAENFGLRKEIITAEALLKYKLLGESSSDRVIAGEDGWLFFAETADDYTGESALSERGIFRLAHTIELMSEFTGQYGITMVFFAAPNKNSIYPEYMPANVLPARGESNLDRLSAQLRGDKCYIDMKSELLRYKDESEQPIYHQLDSHWNNLGALDAFRTIEASLNGRISGFDYEDYRDELDVTETVWDGDLSAMLYPGMKVGDVQYDLGIAQSYTSAKPLTDSMAVEIATVCPGRYFSAICYRDSFFNALIDPVANAFRRARFTRTLPYDLNAAVKDGCNVAIIEIVERNLELVMQNAPLMYAPVRTAPKETADCGSTVSAQVVDSEEAVTVYGTLDGLLKPDITERLFIEMRGTSGSYFFEAFPIAEDDARSDNGFSAMISKHTLPNDDYAMYVHAGSEQSTRCARLTAAAQMG